MAGVDRGNGAADSSRVTTFQLYERLNELDRAQESRHNALTSDLRSITQTVNESVIPELEEHGLEIKGLKARFATSLTMLSGAIGAVIYLYFQNRGVV
jgi:hypothetical protein